MEAAVTALVCLAAVGWVLVGTLTMRRHSRQKRRIVVELDGRRVDLEYGSSSAIRYGIETLRNGKCSRNRFEQPAYEVGGRCME